MKISFLMPAYNAERTLEESIHSILKQKGAWEKELVIIDDGSCDQTLNIARKIAGNYPSIKVAEKINGGEASALNEGLSHITGEFVALVESDVELEDGWLEKVIPEFDDPSVTGVGGRLVTPEGSSWIARIAGYEIEDKFDNKERYPKHITSANAIYRAKVFSEVGRFNERLLNSCLDADLNLRIIKKGYKLAYVKEATAKHYFKDTLAGYLKRQYLYARYRPYLGKTNLYGKDFGLTCQMYLTGFLILSLVIRAIPTLLILSILFIAQLPLTLKLLMEKKDCIVILFPVIMLLRNVTGVIGYSIGIIEKLIYMPKNFLANVIGV